MKIDVLAIPFPTCLQDGLLAFVYEEEPLTRNKTLKALDAASGGGVKRMLALKDFTGKLSTTAVVYPCRAGVADRILLVGLGQRKEMTLERLRGAVAKGVQYARTLGGRSLALTLGELPFDAAQAAEAATEGALLGLYRYLPYKTTQKLEDRRDLEILSFCETDQARAGIVRKAVGKARIVCDAVRLARDLVSTPSNDMTPTDLAETAIRIASRRKSLTVRILDEDEMGRLGMHALLGVARGSSEPAKFIILEYRGAKASEPFMALVGKGLTFDSGGISLKPAEKMDEMKSDMAGGAAVLATLQAVSDLKVKCNVVGIVPATENLPGGSAYKPGDILRTLSGKTIEVLNTDAEGRLILADALAYADRYYAPAAVIDIATLTGGCVVALGENIIGMMGTDDALKKAVTRAAEATGERLWEMPLWEEFSEAIKSDIADIKNSAGRFGSAITAAAFLKEFAGERPWVHLDIAGPSWTTKDRPYVPKGATGVGVRLFVSLLQDRTIV